MLSKEYKMIYITGDTHGNQYKWVEQIESVISPADIIIVCGDFGVGFWNGRYWSEETFYDFLSAQKYTVLFINKILSFAIGGNPLPLGGGRSLVNL